MMLLRYFTCLHLTPMALIATLALPAHSSTLLDTNGKPLPEDFSALVTLLSNTDTATQKLLGISPPKPKVIPPEIKKAKQVEVAPQAPEEVNVVENTVTEPEAEVVAPKVEVPKKNPAFYNEELARRLYDALKIGDAPRVKWMLQSGAGNVYVTNTNDTSLRMATRKGWASVVKILLERDPDLGHELPGKLNLLHEASVKGAYHIAKMLVEAGMDPHAKTTKNWSNLHLAARHGHVDLIRYYLSLGLSPDDRNSEGNTAHWLARHLRHYQAAGYLFSRTSVASYEMFGNDKNKQKNKQKNKKKQVVKKKVIKKRKQSTEFTAEQLKAILG